MAARSNRPIRAALYTRVSTRAQADKHGTAYQRDALERMAEARGWRVVRVHADEGYSGRKASRPALDEMMLAVRRGEVDLVAVWRWDRLFRSLRHMVETLQELEARNVDLVSHQEGTDTSTPLGRAMFQIAAAMSELEAALARERVQAGVDAARARGVRLGRPKAALSSRRARAALNEHGSIRKAARALGVSPSLVARRLRDDRELQSAGT
jgi:DNA invertase Pin-like site-specific DNA recombinase